MKNENTTISVSFDGLGTLLTIVFVILKLCKVIAWGWIYVFLPLIISWGLSILIMIIMVIVIAVQNHRNNPWGKM